LELTPGAFAGLSNCVRTAGEANAYLGTAPQPIISQYIAEVELFDSRRGSERCGRMLA
jgi:hypothetical protein